MLPESSIGCLPGLKQPNEQPTLLQQQAMLQPFSKTAVAFVQQVPIFPEDFDIFHPPKTKIELHMLHLCICLSILPIRIKITLYYTIHDYNCNHYSRGGYHSKNSVLYEIFVISKSQDFFERFLGFLRDFWEFFDEFLMDF